MQSHVDADVMECKAPGLGSLLELSLADRLGDWDALAPDEMFRANDTHVPYGDTSFQSSAVQVF